MTMERDCAYYARKYYKCQIYDDKINALPALLFNMTLTWPFDMWDLDVIKPINPKASNDHRFILATIDYFTKWVNINSYTHVTSRVIKRFIEKDLIFCYGLPTKVIADNTQNFNGKLIAKFCTK